MFKAFLTLTYIDVYFTANFVNMKHHISYSSAQLNSLLINVRDCNEVGTLKERLFNVT